MHEVHLMTQVVKAVETQLQNMGTVKVSTVRLKVSVLSHLLAHDRSALQTAFALAAQGTKAEGATVETIPVPAHAWCPGCRQETLITERDDVCSACEASIIAQPTEPEVVLHELVVME